MCVLFIWWMSYRVVSRIAIVVSTTEIDLTRGSDPSANNPYPRALFAQRLMIQILLVWGTLVFASFVLGSVGWLSAWTLNGTMIAIWGAAGMRLKNLPLNPLVPSFQHRTHRIAWNHLYLALLGSVGIAQVFQMAILTLPQDWDTLAYHLPLVDSWIQTGSVWNQRCAFWYVPGNSELLAFWFCSPFSGDYWGQLNNVLVVILLVTALMEILHFCRIETFWQLIATTGVLACTPVLRQIASAENDIAVAALFLSSMYFILQLNGWTSESNIAKLRWNVLMLAVSLGLMAGVKYYALGYVAIAWLVAFFVLVVRHPFRRSLQIVSILGIGILALGAPWYIRNWIVSGSPLYPKGFRLLGIPDAWENIRPDLAETTLLLGSTWETSRMLFFAWITQGGMYLLLAVLSVVPLSVFSLIAAIRREKRITWLERAEKFTSPGSLIAIACLGAMGIYLVTPNVIETVKGTRNMLQLQYHPVRFGFAFACLSAISFTLWSQRAYLFFRARSSGIARAMKFAIASAAVGSLIWTLIPQYGLRTTIHPTIAHVWLHPSLDIQAMDWLVLTLTSFIVLVLLREIGLWNRRVGVPVFLAAMFCCTTPWQAKHWHESFDGHFQTLLMDNVSRTLDSVAEQNDPVCVCEYRYYGMLGSYRQHSITRPLFTRSDADFQAFLEQGDFQFVVVLKKDDHWLREYEHCLAWIQKSPERFQHVAESGDKILFRRNRDEKTFERD